MRVLIVEDNRWMRAQLELVLKREDYVVDSAPDARTALRFVQAKEFSVIILDLGLPDEEGLNLLTVIREFYLGPVLIVSGRKSITERIRGLDAGADDYMTKPIDDEELLARIRAMIRREQTLVKAQNSSRSLQINLKEQKAVRDGVDLHLTNREFSVLRVLAGNRGDVVKIPDLLGAIVEEQESGSVGLVHAAVSRLRKKLGPGLIENVHGQGYLIRSL